MHSDAADIATTLFLHGESINQRSYESAWTRFTSDEQGRLKSLQEWASGLDTSYWTDLNIERVSRTDSTATAHAQLSTRQDAAYGGPERRTCSDREFVYTFKLVDGVWLIDHANPTSRRAC